MPEQPSAESPPTPALKPGVVAELRQRLERERGELTAQIADLEADVRDASWKEPRSDDDAESGSATFERDRLMSLARNARRTVGQIDAALARMDAGTYGLCVSCGQPIHPDRLDALPQAVQCLECRRREERSIR